MAVDLNDDNALNEKAINFWEKNKKNIFLVFVVFISIYIATSFYVSNQKKNKFLASEIYQKIQVEYKNSDISAYVKELKENYVDTPYSGRASLLYAQILSGNNKSDEALLEFDWAILNSSENSIKSLALYSKAKLHLLQNQLDLAESAINEIETEGFKGLKNYVLGDIYYAKNDNKKALEFYEIAFNFYNNKNDLAKVIKTKIDAIGS